MSKGVSVIVCCYNSAWIIERCLNALLKQKLNNSIAWEIIVVNNASTDGTDVIANRLLNNASIPHKVINEPKQGLVHARKRGVEEAQYSYIQFCDDDNLLCDTYIEQMFEMMESNPLLGACGGMGVAEFQGIPHHFVKKYLPIYAIGPQKGETYLYGAGLCVRASLLKEIYDSHYVLLLTGRCGNRLLAGDDSEITKLILLRHCVLAATEKVTFVHVLSEKRLSYKYLVSMSKGFGLSVPVLMAYDFAINEKKSIIYHYISYIKILIKLCLNVCLMLFQNERIVTVYYFISAIKGYHFWTIRRLHSVVMSSLNLKSASKKSLSLQK